MIHQDRDNNWRDLCQMAATEEDPDKLTVLVAEIISALDERNRKSGPRIQNEKNSREDSFPKLSPVGQPKDQSCESGLSL